MAPVHLTEDQLRRYFLGEGENDEAGQIEEHLLACDQCALRAVYVETSVELRLNALHGQGDELNN